MMMMMIHGSLWIYRSTCFFLMRQHANELRLTKTTAFYLLLYKSDSNPFSLRDIFHLCSWIPQAIMFSFEETTSFHHKSQNKIWSFARPNALPLFFSTTLLGQLENALNDSFSASWREWLFCVETKFEGMKGGLYGNQCNQRLNDLWTRVQMWNGCVRKAAKAAKPEHEIGKLGQVSGQKLVQLPQPSMWLPSWFIYFCHKWFKTIQSYPTRSTNSQVVSVT